MDVRTRFEIAPPDDARHWLGVVQTRVATELAALLDRPDEQALDPRWQAARRQVAAYALRPAKRLRPALAVAGHGLAAGGGAVPAGVWRFAAALELLHTFLLVHDDVADGAGTRRGLPALHRQLGDAKHGEDLAVVAGDYLFARAVEAMLESGLPGAADAVRFHLAVCRHTAAGQFLDLELSRVPLAEVTLLQTLRVALLKTARYGFVGPLVGGAMLGGAGAALCAELERVGSQAGLAFQLRDDLLGLFGDPTAMGKPVTADLAQGKRTFPVIAAYARAPENARREFERLWSTGDGDAAAAARARALVELHGGRARTERVIERATLRAQRALRALPAANGMRGLLAELIDTLARRER